MAEPLLIGYSCNSRPERGIEKTFLLVYNDSRKIRSRVKEEFSS